MSNEKSNSTRLYDALLRQASGECTDAEREELQRALTDDSPESAQLRLTRDWIATLESGMADAPPVDVPPLPELNRERILAAARQTAKTADVPPGTKTKDELANLRERRIAKLQLWGAAAIILAVGLLALRPWETQTTAPGIAPSLAGATVEEILNAPFQETSEQLDAVAENIVQTSLDALEEEELVWIDPVMDSELNALASILLANDGV